MRLKDVTAIIPQFGVELTFTQRMNAKLENATLKGGTIILDRVTDKLDSCRISHCKIVSSVPLSIYNSYIMTPHAILNERRENDHPHATIVNCLFNLCHMPKAHYEYNYIKTDSPDYALTKYGTNYLEKNPRIPTPTDWKSGGESE